MSYRTQDKSKRIRRKRSPVNYLQLSSVSKKTNQESSKASNRKPHSKKEVGISKNGLTFSQNAEGAKVLNQRIMPNGIHNDFPGNSSQNADQHLVAILTSLHNSRPLVPIVPKPVFTPTISNNIYPVYPYYVVPSIQGQAAMGNPVYPYPAGNNSTHC